MPRIRTVKPETWEDEKFASLKRDCRLMFIGMFNFSDDGGVIKANPTYIKSRIFPYDEDLRISELKSWLDALVKARMLIPFSYNDESYYLIRTFHCHQIIDKRYARYAVPQEYVKGLFSGNAVLPQLSHSDHDVNTPQEGKGKEGIGGEDPTESEILVFSAEVEIVSNQLWFESICMKTYKNVKSAETALRKFHLYNVEKSRYPMSKKAIYAGFEKWLMNEKGSPAPENKHQTDIDMQRAEYAKNRVNYPIA